MKSGKSASVRRPHFTNMFGQMVWPVVALQIQQLNMRQPEDGTDVHQNAKENVMQCVMYNRCIKGWF